MQAHIIKNGVVVNTILATVAEAQTAYPDATCIDASTGGIGWLWDGQTLAPPPSPVFPLSRAQAAGLQQIDADVDALYARVIGNRAAEYEQAEREATAYAHAGYAGTVPGMVDAWAQAKGWSGQQAADDIITQANAWRSAQTAIRAARLLRKEQVRAAEDVAAVNAALAAWGQFLAAIRAQLGVT